MKLPVAIDVDALSDELLERVAAGEERLITRDGRPIALLIPTSAETLENQLRALQAEALGRIVGQIRAQAVASGASALTEDEIQAEIDAVRRQRRSH